MEFIKLEGQSLLNFYASNPTDYLSETAGSIRDAEYYGVIVGGNIVAATSYIKMTDHLVLMQSTMVVEDCRGKGVGRFLNENFEIVLKELGFGKIESHVYIENIPSIILKLKLGYLVEGTLYDHDFIGQHEYILGKNIKSKEDQ